MEKVGGYPRAGGRFHFEKDWKILETFGKYIFVCGSLFASLMTL